jgi:hypothetical protein
MIAAELHIPPYRLGDLTVDQLRQAVAWCKHEQARRAEER